MSNTNPVRYDAYKDSGVGWIGNVPKNWTLLRVKDTVIKIGNGVTPKGGSEVYTDVGIPFIRSQNVYDDGLHLGNVSFISEEIHRDMNSSQLKEEDILINITGASIGRTCVVPIELGIANINQHVAFLRTKHWFNTNYISLFLKSPLIKKYIQFEQNGASKEAFNLTQIANIPIVLPNAEKQQAISAYLGTKTAHIDRKIDLLSQKAAQYGMLKQSLINETVTRGLDKTVAMKDSGIDWIGEVPAHWNIEKLSQSFSQIGSGTTPKSGVDIYYECGTTNWINTGDLNDDILNSCKRTISDKALQDYSLTIYPVGSIIIAMYGATIGKVSISEIDGCVNQACCVLNNSKTINAKFLFYWFLSKRDFVISLSYGGGQPNISQETIKSLRIISPSMVEQKRIADYLDDKTTKIDRIIKTINTQIDKLKELRKTLINDVVTGKIKVE